MKTAEEILKDTLGDIRYGLNGNEMNNQIIHAMEMYLLQSSLPSPSLPSDEEIKAYYTNQHFHHIDGRNYKIKNNHIEGAKWMRSLCSTRIAEMEMEVKRLRFMIDNGLGSKDIQNDI